MDEFSLDKIASYVRDYDLESDEDTWSDLLPSYQLLIVKWLVDQLYLAQASLENLGY